MRSEAVARASLEEIAARARPVALAREHVLPVLEPLQPVVPDGLPRGTTVAVGGSTSLALALVAGPARAGSWVATMGVASLGLAAAAELGVPLDRLVLVADPGRVSAWAGVVATLVDAFDVVLVRPPGRVAIGDARRLVARAREKGTVLVVLDQWESPDLRLTLAASQWEGLGDGHGHLQARRVTVEATGRRGWSRPRTAELWLPAAGGGVATAEPVASVHPLTPRSLSAEDGYSAISRQRTGRVS